MTEQRLIDANKEVMRAYEDIPEPYSDVLISFLRDCETIDPESLPIVQQLREKLKNEIAKKEICGETIERLDKQLEKVTAERDKIAQYELDACGEYCFGDSSTGISECEWLYSNGRCKLKEWAEGRKETDRE